MMDNFIVKRATRSVWCQRIARRDGGPSTRNYVLAMAITIADINEVPRLWSTYSSEHLISAEIIPEHCCHFIKIRSPRCARITSHSEYNRNVHMDCSTSDDNKNTDKMGFHYKPHALMMCPGQSQHIILACWCNGYCGSSYFYRRSDEFCCPLIFNWSLYWSWCYFYSNTSHQHPTTTMNKERYFVRISWNRWLFVNWIYIGICC